MLKPIVSKTDWSSISKEITQALNSPLANQQTNRKTSIVRISVGGAR